MELNPNIIIPKVYLGLKWLITLFTIYFVVNTVWAFIEPPSIVSNINQPLESPQAVNSQPIDLNRIISRNLFGESASSGLKKSVPSTPTTVTKLPLTLLSVFASQTDSNSAAIISQRDQPPKRYKISDTVPGNAILVEIFKDKVILLRAGNREILTFPKITSTFEAVLAAKKQDAPQRSTSQNTVPKPKQQISERDTKTITGPAGRFPISKAKPEKNKAPNQKSAKDVQDFIADQENLSFNDEGGMVIDDGISNSYLRQTGLQEGDIVLSVNGRPARSIGSNKTAIQSILAEGSARIEIQRGSRRFIITASVPR